jgi:hypothetical protein
MLPLWEERALFVPSARAFDSAIAEPFRRLGPTSTILALVRRLSKRPVAVCGVHVPRSSPMIGPGRPRRKGNEMASG